MYACKSKARGNGVAENTNIHLSMKKYKTELIIVLMLAFFVLALNTLNIYINV